MIQLYKDEIQNKSSDFARDIFKKCNPELNFKFYGNNGRVIIEVANLEELISALQETHDYFEKIGTKASDHGVLIPFGYNIEHDRADAIIKKRLEGNSLSLDEEKDYMSYMLHQFGKMNAKSNWVMQIHLGAVRDVRDYLYDNKNHR